MITIADIISNAKTQSSRQCELVVSRDTTLIQALMKMQEAGCEHIGIENHTEDDVTVLSKAELMEAMVKELDAAHDKLSELKEQVGEDLNNQVEMIRANAKAMAEQENNRLEVAINYMTEGLIILNCDGHIEKCNPSAKKMLGLNTDDGTEELSSAIDDLGLRELIQNNAKNSDNSWGQFNVRSASGGTLQMRWTELIDETGELLGNLVMIRNITNELAGDKAKTEFIAAITHELRTPVTIIQNSVSNILAGVTGKINEKLRSYLLAMESDCRRFGNLISDLLDISKLESGTMLINRKVMKIEDVVNKAIAGFAEEATTKNIQLTVTFDEYICPLCADVERIYQCMVNLLSNAIKFTNEGGKVAVSVSDKNDGVIVCVEDTGIGISPSVQKQIFRKFSQIDRQAGAGYKGAGLGLPLCSGIVKAHGGTMRVESEPDNGSKFFMTLPKTDPSIVMNKHLADLVKTSAGNNNEFSLAIVKFDTPAEEKGQLREITGNSVKTLLAKCRDLMNDTYELMIQMNDFEAFFVIASADQKRLNEVTKKIHKIVENKLMNNLPKASVVPMFGISTFIGDSSEVIELENIARNTARPMF